MTNLKTIPRGALNAIFAYYSSYLNLGIVKMLSKGHCSNWNQVMTQGTSKIRKKTSPVMTKWAARHHWSFSISRTRPPNR